MNAIKTYLLALFLALFFIFPTFAQSNFDDNKFIKQEQQLSKIDSILINCYFTEKEYNRIHGIKQSKPFDDEVLMYEDEIYNGKKYKKTGRDNLLNDIPVEVVVDVVLNTLFFIAVLWQ